MNRYEMRIGDSERDAAVTALGEHYVAGRLTKEEYDERAAVAWQARTNSDLAPLFYDLPPLQAPQRPPSPATASGSKAVTRTARGGGGGVPVLPVLVLVLIVALASELPVWPLLLLLVAYLWVKASFWRRQARRQSRRERQRAVADPWCQWRRP